MEKCSVFRWPNVVRSGRHIASLPQKNKKKKTSALRRSGRNESSSHGPHKHMCAMCTIAFEAENYPGIIINLICLFYNY